MSTQPVKQWTFGAIVVYAPDLFHAREVYELLVQVRSPEEAFGTVTLEDGTQVRWIDMSRR
jgi:hypothetical protein